MMAGDNCRVGVGGRRVGVYQVVNHGVLLESIGRANVHVRRMSAKPFEEKNKLEGSPWEFFLASYVCGGECELHNAPVVH